jgi:hypothetical protein
MPQNLNNFSEIQSSTAAALGSIFDAPHQEKR